MNYNPLLPNNNLPVLPGDFNYDDPALLKLVIKATDVLSKLNGLALLLPNVELLLAPLLIKESVESNAIENINTTTIKVLQAEAMEIKATVSGPEKEVLYYRKALLLGIEKMKEYGGIPVQLLLDLQTILEPHKAGVRKIPGTVIANKHEVLYTPPEGKEVLLSLLSNLEKWINNDDAIHPLIKVGVIHYQFESIHPFYDGNGRTGRILMMLYLIMTHKLDYPVLFLSEYINETRDIYYNSLNQINRGEADYSLIITYILEGIIKQATLTQEKIMNIRNLIESTQDLIKLNTKYDYHNITKILFSHPYLTVGDFGNKLNISKATVLRYMSALENIGVIKTIKSGKYTLLYIPQFIQLLS